MSFIQQFFTSRDNNANAQTFVGQEGRLWFDPVTNQMYSSNGNTPGGIPLSGGGGTPGGSDAQVQFNNNGAFGGTANLTINSATGALTAVSVNTGVITLTNGLTINDTVGNSIAFGYGAGYAQSYSAIAIGDQTGNNGQGKYAIAIGDYAGWETQGNYAVSIGSDAGYSTQGLFSVAIGPEAGATNQGANSVAIGSFVAAANQGINAVAIGSFAGYSNQGNNSIIINGTGVALNQTTANTFTVAPVRNDVANTAQVMFYNTTSKEITYGNTIGVAGNVTGGNLTTGGNLVLSNVNINSNTNAIQGWSYANVALSITAAESTPAGLFFGNAGSSFYVVGTTNDRVLQYNMSSTNMANTGVLFGNVIVSGQDGTPNDLFIDSTGANMYVLGQTNRVVYQYTIPTPWNITTATYATLSANVAAQDTTPTGLWFKPDLTTMYMVGSTNNTVYQYTLSTPGNIATATYASKSFNVTAGGAGGGGTGAVNLSSDGAKMWTIASSVPSIAEYNLATPWDVSTASYVLGNTVGILAQEGTPTGMFVDLANSRAWIIGSSNDTVYQYNTANSIIQTANAVGIRGQLAVQGNAWFAQQVQFGNAVRVENTFTVDSTFSSGSTVVMSTTTGTISIGTSQTTGNTLIGNATQTGSLALGQSTATQTVNIANGAVSSGNTKTVSLATGGVANSVSAVTIFSGVAGNSTLTIGASTGNTTVSYTANSTVAIANTSGTALSVTGNITGGNILTGGILRTTAIVVASLPTAAGAAAGARSFVTDATAATFGTIVAGGGANAVPVWSDGTNWKIG